MLLQVALHGPAFTGLRHFLFVVPPLAALAGIGLSGAISALNASSLRLAMASGIAVIAGLGWPAVTLVRLHPYEYLYFNELVGGLQGANRRFDTDYWVNIMPQAVDDLEAFLDRTIPKARRQIGQSYTVAVCGERFSFEKERDDSRLQWTSDWKNADFFIAPMHMDCDRALEGKIVGTIERLGVPIGVIKDRRDLTKPAVAIGPGAPTDL